MSQDIPEEKPRPIMPSQAKYKDKTGKEHTQYVTITQGMRGYFAVLMHLNTEHEDGLGDFWEPWNTSDVTGRNANDCIGDAKTWAWSEQILFTYGEEEIDYSLVENQKRIM
jgi:hypothetical protein